ncbi:hypothetical protein ACIQW7_05205 [Peribacillus simplex]|jgi:hypothetical protein|uniref:hypothetical protein n=1 Tax=Peribacillus simplex TaxID=1478 RepID=UPI003815D002
MIEDLARMLEGTTESEPFDKSREYLTNAKRKEYSPEQAMNNMLKEPTVFLAPVVFIIFTSDTGLNITLKDYAFIIMQQAKQKSNQTLFQAAKAAYEIGKETDI